MIKHKYNIGQDVYYINIDTDYTTKELIVVIEKFEIEEVVLDKDNKIRYRVVNDSQKFDEDKLFDSYADAKAFLLAWWNKIVDDLDRKEKERNGEKNEN